MGVAGAVSAGNDYWLMRARRRTRGRQQRRDSWAAGLVAVVDGDCREGSRVRERERKGLGDRASERRDKEDPALAAMDVWMSKSEQKSAEECRGVQGRASTREQQNSKKQKEKRVV